MRKVFFSFHYERDNWRVSQIKNIGIVEGQKICNSNDWEEVKRGGRQAIERWISQNMYGCSCVIVLIGNQTASREWVKYEIIKAWNEGKALMGIYIHNLKDSFGKIDYKGNNPFDYIYLEKSGETLSRFIPVFEPNPYNAHKDISDNLGNWIENAIKNKKN